MIHQPPSGGCVLKRHVAGGQEIKPSQPPSGGCVLKPRLNVMRKALSKPAAFGRLCVETPFGNGDGEPDWASRLRAAVC